MRDYKKGKFLMESRPGQLLPIGTRKEGQASAEEQQKRILDKIWGTVDKVIGDLRKQLLGKLQEPTRSLEEQEKTIEYYFLFCVMRRGRFILSFQGVARLASVR